MKTKSIILSLIMMFCFVLAASAQDSFLKIGDIKGESASSGHEEWIVIESVQHALGMQQAIATGASRRRGNVVLGELIVTTKVDKATPKLLEACASGQAFPQSELDFVGSNGRTSYKITLTNARVNRVSTNYDCDQGCKLIAEVAIQGSGIKWEQWDSRGRKIEASYDAQRGN